MEILTRLRPGRLSEKPVLKRCRSDEATRLRQKYEPYYHTFERQEGARVWLDGREMVMLASNDYLGIGRHPKVVEAGQRALAQWGAGTTGARLANGSRRFHVELEEQLAAFLGKEACHVSVAGYISCMSAVQAFAQPGDCVFVDKNIHSSLWAGAGLTRASIERIAHNRPDDLREALAFEKPGTPKLCVIEGVYSMEGHLAPLPGYVEICGEHGVFLILDDAHGFGVLGVEGRGTASHYGLSAEVDIISGSFSKALGSTGGFVAGSREAIDYLRTHSKQTIFSAALSPVQAACASAALDVMQEEPGHRERLWENTRRYKALLEGMGLDIWESETPAVPIVLGNRERAYRAWKRLKELGVFTVLSIAPAVPPGKDLLRTAVSAAHTEEDLAWVAEALAKALK